MAIQMRVMVLESLGSGAPVTFTNLDRDEFCETEADLAATAQWFKNILKSHIIDFCCIFGIFELDWQFSKT